MPDRQEILPPSAFEPLLREEGDILSQIERENVEAGINLIGPSVGKLLYMTCKLVGAKRVLELGTAHGYSTVWLARAVGEDGHVTGTEFLPEVAAEAERTLQRTGMHDRVHIHIGDAMTLIATSSEQYDLIFLDIEKEWYSKALPDCVRLLRKGGVLFVDNVAFESAGAFNLELNDHPELETSFVYGVFSNHSPDEDAVSISRKK